MTAQQLQDEIEELVPRYRQARLRLQEHLAAVDSDVESWLQNICPESPEAAAEVSPAQFVGLESELARLEECFRQVDVLLTAESVEIARLLTVVRPGTIPDDAA